MRQHIIRGKERIIVFLSYRPKLYAFIVGIGIVWFWRGVWHSTDLIHTIFSSSFLPNPSVGAYSPWWDGLLSLFAGSVVLYFTGAFISSFIGNELILSGLRGEERLNKKTESEVKSEKKTIIFIKDELEDIRKKIEELEEISNKKNDNY